MSNFSERLKEYMQDEGFSTLDIENAIGLNHGNVSGFLSGKHLPTYAILVKFLNLFNCSADYLLGITDTPTEENLFPANDFIGEKLIDILKTKGITKAKFIRDLPVSSSVLYRWTNQNCNPSTSSLMRIAEYLDCSIDYLIGRLR